MKYIPIVYKIENKNILVVGGGNVALQKLMGIMHFSNAVTVVAPLICEEIRAKGVLVKERAYCEGDSEGYALVYACTNRRDVNAIVARDARSYGALVCVADYQADCDFISPAVFVEDPMVVAISSQGENIKKTLSWRDKIKEMFDRGKA